jgi:hypothetical protein
MHVCKAIIQDYKKIKNPELFLDFFFEKWQGFRAKLHFLLFYQNLIKTIFFKNSKRTWLKKMARDIDFRTRGGRESLWTNRRKNPIFMCPLRSPKTTKSGFFFSRALT